MRYDLIGDKLLGFSKVYKDGKWGLVEADNYAKEVVAPEWEVEPEEEKGFILVKSKDGKCGLLFADAQEFLPIIYDKIQIKMKQDDPRIIVHRLDGRCALYADSIEPLIPFSAKYSNLEYISDEIIIAHRKDKCGIININQKEVLPLEYTKLCQSFGTRWYVSKDDKIGVIDIITKKYLLPCEFMSIDHVAGFYKAKVPDGKCRLYDIDGIEIGVACDAIQPMIDSFYKVSDGKFQGVLKIERKENEYEVTYITDIKYSTIGNFVEGFAIVANVNDCEGFINERGEHVGTMNFESVRNFQNGMAAVECRKVSKSAWGFMDTTGEVVIPCTYDKVEDFNSLNYASACKNGKWTIINKKGEELVDCIYDVIGHIEQYPGTNIVRAEVILDNNNGFIEFSIKPDEN